jgi:hypothetical protein
MCTLTQWGRLGCSVTLSTQIISQLHCMIPSLCLNGEEPMRMLNNTRKQIIYNFTARSCDSTMQRWIMKMLNSTPQPGNKELQLHCITYLDSTTVRSRSGCSMASQPGNNHTSLHDTLALPATVRPMECSITLTTQIIHSFAAMPWLTHTLRQWSRNAQ